MKDSLINSSALMPQTARSAFDQKIDLFFERHIQSFFNPAQIHWWFSLSGGKDSFAMALGVRRWYERREIPLFASVFVIDQWGGAAAKSIQRQLKWAGPLTVVDGRALTQQKTGYQAGQQAPCRNCSDARRDLTDELLLQSSRKITGLTNIVCRGLHLSDTAVSLAWRNAIGRDSTQDMIESGKARPISKLQEGTFLAKPLAYVREFESAAYANESGFVAECCGCPACRFPSRRDIVEETVCQFYGGSLWEFDVPGMTAYLEHLGVDQLRRESAPGIQPKHSHLPQGFARFVVEKFRRIAHESQARWASICDASADLDQIGRSRLLYSLPFVHRDKVPLPALLRNADLSAEQEAMIATMGPFWGAIGLEPDLASRAWELQEAYFAFVPDNRWSQVNKLLHEFYSSSLVRKQERIVNFSRRSTGDQNAVR